VARLAPVLENRRDVLVKVISRGLYAAPEKMNNTGNAA
jgi:hypothetical protein